MKKVLFAIAMIAVVALSGCTKPEPKIQKRLVMCGTEGDNLYAFTYGADGKIALVNRNNGERTWTFTWNGNKADIHYIKDGEDKGNFPLTLGANGFITNMVTDYGEAAVLSYDKDGYLTKIERGGALKSNLVWQNGNLVKWSRFSSGKEEFKNQTFLADENIAGIFPDSNDKVDINRWMFELGMCGKPSANLLDQAAWDGAEDIAVLKYTKDADGYVTKVEKYYGGKIDEVYLYQWEVIKAK